MKLVKERRRAYAWRLRVYIDAVKQAEATTDEEWIDRWVAHAGPDDRFIPRSIWVEILKRWALEEVQRISHGEVA